MVTREVEIIYQAAALAHPKQSLDRLAVEAGGFDGPQGGKDFFKPLKLNRLGSHSGLLPSTIR